jgi:hypothetical protein
VQFQDQQFEDTGLGTPEGSRQIGLQHGRRVIEDYLTAAVSAAIGAINAIGAAAIHDASTTPAGAGNFTFDVLNSGLGKFGDARSQLRTLVMHSTPHTNWLSNAMSTQAIAFQVGGASVYEGDLPSMNLRRLITDQAVLTEDEASSLSGWTSANSTNFYSLALRPGAVRIKTGPLRTSLDRVTGALGSAPENMTWIFQVEWSFEVKVAGVSYKAASNNNPTDSVLSTSSNWETAGAATSHKFGPGVLIKTDG